MGKLDGRVAIITGSAQGIGAAYAKGMASEGAKVVVSDVLDPETTVGIIRQAGGEAIGIKADVTDEAAVKNLIDKTLAAYGKIDIMVTNAALFGKLEHNKFEDIDPAEWDTVMRVNVRGVWQCIKAVVPHMRKQKYGKIVNIASGTVFKGTPMLLHYVSSKGAIVALTRSIAREVGDDNICVNAIAPGLTESENVLNYPPARRNMTVGSRAFKRAQLPEDLVGACVFLSSADSDFMTGQTLVVDGGSTMH